MIEIADIRDGDSLRAWLTERPEAAGLDEEDARALAVTIAHRSAMRVLPLWWAVTISDIVQQVDLTALPVLRCALISGVAGRTPTPEIRNAAAAAANAANSSAANSSAANAANSSAANSSAANSATAYANAATAATATANAANAAAYATAATAASATAYANAAAYATAATAASATAYANATNAAAYANAAHAATAKDFWDIVQDDCRILAEQKGMIASPLWHGRENPMEQGWESVKDAAVEPEWAFWIRWYEDALAGREPDWDLLKKIALIDNAVWAQGPKAVAEDIDNIRLKYAIIATPFAERIELNPDTGKLRSVSESTLPSDHLADALDKMRDAVGVFDMQSGGNDMYGILLAERELIADAVDRYGHRPIRLHDACGRATRRVADKIANGDCAAGDALVNDFVAQLAEVVLDIRGFDTKVQDVVARRQLVTMRELPGEARATYIEASNEVAEGSEPELAEQLLQDALASTDRTLPELERKEALNRQAGRLLRAWQVGRKGLEGAAKFVKDVSIVGGGGALVTDGYLWMTGKLPMILPWLLSLF